MSFCIKCGAELGAGVRFCYKCGQPVSLSSQTNLPLYAPANVASGITMLDYINKRIREESVYIDAISYITGTKTAPVGAITRRFIADKEQYQIPGNKNFDLSDLAVKLSQGLVSLPFTEWQSGNPKNLGFVDATQNVIQFKFNNQTIHRIVFDINKTGFYKIEAVNATRKERLKYMSNRNGLILKNLTKIKPVIHFAVDYYFINL